MGLDMSDFVKYANEFKNMEADFNKFLKNWLTKEGYITLEDIKKNTPVDTGNLRNSWQLKDVKTEGNKPQFTVYNPVQEYASIIEYGTPARPKWKWAEGAHMMQKGIFNALDRMPKTFDEAFIAFLKSKGLA